MGHNNDNDNAETYYVHIEDACVQLARENYYTGCILEQISGTPSLYCTNREEKPFSFTLCGNNNGESWIEFDNIRKRPVTPLCDGLHPRKADKFGLYQKNFLRFY